VPLAGLHGLSNPAHASAVHPVHSLIDQSLHSRLRAETTNGDGFGIGWYDAALLPGVFS
jgi:predicted glutamine amidotransferase